jgi:hypothetical protein
MLNSITWIILVSALGPLRFDGAAPAIRMRLRAYEATPWLKVTFSRQILPQPGSDLLERPAVACDHQRRGNADRVLVGVFRENASPLQSLAVAARGAGFRPAGTRPADRAMTSTTFAIEVTVLKPSPKR